MVLSLTCAFPSEDSGLMQGTPHLQWRARAGITPASLFSPEGAPGKILFPVKDSSRALT